jgi:hypothetical protein
MVKLVDSQQPVERDAPAPSLDPVKVSQAKRALRFLDLTVAAVFVGYGLYCESTIALTLGTLGLVLWVVNPAKRVEAYVKKRVSTSK